eukprot:2508214-Lingulodinium_polyedra.AAC.1
MRRRRRPRRRRCKGGARGFASTAADNYGAVLDARGPSRGAIATGPARGWARRLPRQPLLTIGNPSRAPSPAVGDD